MDQALQEALLWLGLLSSRLDSGLMDHLLEHSAANLVETVVLEPAEDLLFILAQGCQHLLDRGLGFTFFFLWLLRVTVFLVLLRVSCELGWRDTGCLRSFKKAVVSLFFRVFLKAMWDISKDLFCER